MINKIKMQSGRSMIEMLAVLAVVGVLSVGALQGYSQAMLNHKANGAINSINKLVFQIKEAYEEEGSYTGIDNATLITADILNSDGTTDEIETPVVVTSPLSTVFTIKYDFENSTELCTKVTTGGWKESLGENFIAIEVYSGNALINAINDPSKIDDVLLQCSNATADNMLFYFK
ncbi:MAG: prepilin-type N-terminal cleavage/methylation domain-containing protein [Alphaproteobacteria bacterium]|nr:prepilin-type N-terminal cleavage/methylation domain-containing protein [Alphaproteobacteria bacterium]